MPRKAETRLQLTIVAWRCAGVRVGAPGEGGAGKYVRMAKDYSIYSITTSFKFFTETVTAIMSFVAGLDPRIHCYVAGCVAQEVRNIPPGVSDPRKT